MPDSNSDSSWKFGRNAATSSAERSATNTCDGPRSYQSTGSSDSTPSAERSSSARSYARQRGIGCVIEPHGDGAGEGLEPDLVELQWLRQHERRAERRMTGERKLGARREDPDAGVPVALGRQHEHALREIHLAGEPLH